MPVPPVSSQILNAFSDRQETDGARSVLPPWLVLVILLVIFSPLFDGGTTHSAVLIIRVLILALVSVYLWQGFRTGVMAYHRLSAGPAVLAYLGLAVVSAMMSPYFNQSVQWLIVLFGYALVLYVVAAFLSEWSQIAVLLAVVAGMALVEAGWVLTQRWQAGLPRPTGTFFNPNFLAGYVAAIWALVLGILCHLRVADRNLLRGRRPAGVQLACAALLASLFLAVLLTGSRGGMLALAAGSTVVLGIRFGRRGLALLVAGLVLVTLVVPNPLRERIRVEHEADPVGYARWQMWQSSARAMIEHPLGVGVGLYQYIYPRYAFPVEGEIIRYGKVAQTPHSEYVQMGVELGVASLVVFAWGCAGVARAAVWWLRQRLRRWQRGVVVGLCGGIVAILVHAAVDSNLHEPAIAVVLVLYVGIVLSARRLAGRAGESFRLVPVRFRLLWAGIAAVAIVALGVLVVRIGSAWHVHEAGLAALSAGDDLRAASYFQQAIALDPGKALYHSALAAAEFHRFEQTGDVAGAQRAVSELDTAIALNPLDGRLPGLLGSVYATLATAPSPAAGASQDRHAQRGIWREAAVSAYERALRLEPYNPFHRLEAARLHLALGHHEQAETAARRAVELEPNFLPGREWLAKLYLNSARGKEAAREYREIVERRQRFTGWHKSAADERFLAADVAGLEAALGRSRPPA